jgi:hypothetical protein
MAIPARLLSELLELPEDQRLEVASVLLDSVVGDDDDLDDADRERLHAALARSLEDVRNGRIRPAREVLDAIRKPSAPR